MSDQEAPGNILTGPQDVDRRIDQLRDGLRPWQRALLRALCDGRRALSAGEWIVRAQRLAHNVLRVEEFVELRDSLLTAGVVAQRWPGSASYYATPLGRCVVSNLLEKPIHRRRRSRCGPVIPRSTAVAPGPPGTFIGLLIQSALSAARDVLGGVKRRVCWPRRRSSSGASRLPAARRVGRTVARQDTAAGTSAERATQDSGPRGRLPRCWRAVVAQCGRMAR